MNNSLWGKAANSVVPRDQESCSHFSKFPRMHMSIHHWFIFKLGTSSHVTYLQILFVLFESVIMCVCPTHRGLLSPSSSWECVREERELRLRIKWGGEPGNRFMIGVGNKEYSALGSSIIQRYDSLKKELRKKRRKRGFE